MTEKLKITFLIIGCLLIAYFLIGKNIVGKVKISPQINKQTQIVTPSQATNQPTTIQNQQVTQSMANDSCRDGNTIRQNVKPCSQGLECYSLTPMNERYCRLPDGTCKFFCNDK